MENINIKIRATSIIKASYSVCKRFAVLVFTLFMVVNAHAQHDHDADTTKLITKAKRSTDLYVEPAFNFESHRTYTLDFSVTDKDGEPLSGVILLISSIPDDVEDVDDEALLDKSLMSILRTDQYGRVYQQVEAAKIYTNLLVELNMQTEGNKVIVDASETDYVSHHFMLN